PAAPKIFHGRQQQLEHIINTLEQHENSHVAVLGPGGIGKTSLAQATLHHPNIVEKFGPHRYWIACDSSESANDLLVIISSYFSINARNRLHAILSCIQAISTPVFLVLDNFETPWEQRSTRAAVEEVLSHLTGLDNLSMLITMRGSERPAKVQWTRPFLAPLAPISTEAARQTFLDISDADIQDPHLDELLSLTDKMPLVVSLLASVAESEGCATTLTRWKSESTSLLSDGFNKQSNLDKSIEASLHSARLKSVPNAQHLLSILSYLPDGITLLEFEQIDLSVSDFGYCQSTLHRTSLAYITADDRLKLLAPVREYIQKKYPPPLSSILSVRSYFFDL
ncbi:P-loop containing nucleoside triphosphate hydrolase protein, partial [Mycena floridula]